MTIKLPQEVLAHVFSFLPAERERNTCTQYQNAALQNAYNKAQKDENWLRDLLKTEPSERKATRLDLDPSSIAHRIRKNQYFDNGSKAIAWSYDWATIWDAKTGEKIVDGYQDGIRFLRISPDNSTVTFCLNRKATIWNAETGENIGTLKVHSEPIQDIEYSANGFEVTTCSPDRAVTWDAKTGKEIGCFYSDSVRIRHVQWSCSGPRAFTNLDDGVTIWDAKTGDKIVTLNGLTSILRAPQYSPDGFKIMTWSYDEVTIWDAKTGEKILTLKGDESRKGLEFGISGAQYSPDGDKIMTWSDNEAKICDATNGAEIIRFVSGSDRIINVQYSNNGPRVFTRSYNEVTIWDAKTGEKIVTLKGDESRKGLESRIWGAQYSPDGLKIITSSENGDTIWNLLSYDEENTVEQRTAEESTIKTVAEQIVSKASKILSIGLSKKESEMFLDGVTQRLSEHYTGVEDSIMKEVQEGILAIDRELSEELTPQEALKEFLGL